MDISVFCGSFCLIENIREELSPEKQNILKTFWKWHNFICCSKIEPLVENKGFYMKKDGIFLGDDISLKEGKI